jgi:hypothetical protein
VYQEILAEIIANTKKKFLKLLEAVPELLPYEPPADSEFENRALLEGIWKNITDEEWERALYMDTVASLDNRDNLN